ncbi:MAG: alanine--tRNA ligase [Planctomycetales bacterium]|nr:alanine--tRNA ligase [Planctomycetales bacterium]
MHTDEIREKYLDFFVSKGHSRQPSDVLVPKWDNSVLFTPAGMNQFKDHFLGKVKLEFTRATTAQKCLRTGDIDNVGVTAYHHTFFEMLGNFSFGDYFKREAIQWAWEFLTDKKWLALDADRLSATVYLDDDEAAEIWANVVGLPASRITRMGEDDNFWPAGAPSQGPDGVCGPCSEIFYRDNSGQLVEIWNLVFTQFNRVGPPPENLKPLPSKNIDTGMGLERIASVMQGKTTNYHIDILRPLVEAAGEVCELKYNPDDDNGRRMRRIADHVRACTFAIHENVYPGRNKEKYVIRRLLRRAVLDGHQMGRREPFLYQLVPVVADMMKQPYPELLETVDRVAQVMRQEENAFLNTLDSGIARLDKLFAQMSEKKQTLVPASTIRDLYDTYGIPVELSQLIVHEKGFAIDADDDDGPSSGGSDGMDTELFKPGPVEDLKKAHGQTEFLGYEQEEAEATVLGIVLLDEDQTLGDYDPNEGNLQESIAATGERICVVVLDQTPFYGESGGQVGDQGRLLTDDMEFEVVDAQKNGGLTLHVGFLRSGTLVNNSKVRAVVDSARREGIRRAHSATHMLHYALQETLGKHAQQQGSKVERDELRFDFTNLEPVHYDQLQHIEQLVNERILSAEPIQWQTLPLADARERGAMMLFGEKYPDPVRMVSMGEFSRELCGGTHLTNTSQVEKFEIVEEGGVAAGTRRVTAYTGVRAREHEQQTQQLLSQLAEQLGCGAGAVPKAVENLMATVRTLKKQVGGGSAGEELKPATGKDPADYAAAKRLVRDAARHLNVPASETPHRVAGLQDEAKQLQAQLEKLAASGDVSADSLIEGATEVNGVKVIIHQLPIGNSNLMRQLIDQIRQKTSPVAVLLAAEDDGKVQLVAGVSKEIVDRVHSGKWVGIAAKAVGGGGGGKPDMAQAGGKDPAKLPDAMQQALQAATEMLA